MNRITFKYRDSKYDTFKNNVYVGYIYYNNGVYTFKTVSNKYTPLANDLENSKHIIEEVFQ